MRRVIGWMCAAMVLGGCLQPKPPANPPLLPPDKKKTPQTYITPAFGAVGRVEMVNLESRFVVLSFPAGHVPAPGQTWRINHRGLQIGRVKISGPQRQIDTVADIVEGEANVGDEAEPQ
jgi:hypothetical protein